MSRRLDRESLPTRFGGTLLVKRLAVGGMAEVYLAVEEPPLGGRRFVVVKRVRADYVDEPEYAQFFLTEGRISLKCHHPNLPVAYRLDETDGLAYLVLEYIQGLPVLAILRGAVGRHRPLGVAAAVEIGLATGRALDHLHGLADLDGTPLGVIHRDVSPHNLLVATGGVVKLIDLGIARAVLQTHHTQTGVVKGKYAYMAPEQLGPEHRLDPRADLFSLGAVVHELLVGRPLFQGASDLDTCERVKHGRVPHPSAVCADVPRAIGDVVMTALERDPDRRWRSAEAMVAALEDAAAHAGVWPSPETLWREALALAGPAPRPRLVDGVLEWTDAPATAPRLYPAAHAGGGTVMEVADGPGPGGRVRPAAELDRDAAPEAIDDEPTAGAPAPEPAADDEARRDPALSYYLHVGAVPEPMPDGGDTDRTSGKP